MAHHAARASPLQAKFLGVLGVLGAGFDVVDAVDGMELRRRRFTTMISNSLGQRGNQ